jgi:hypothetical protein
MYSFRNSIWDVALLLAFPFLSQASPCQVQPLLNQREDVATILHLEQEWTRAYLRGDTDFELCLLTPDFTENNAHRRDESSQGRVGFCGSE